MNLFRQSILPPRRVRVGAGSGLLVSSPTPDVSWRSPWGAHPEPLVSADVELTLRGQQPDRRTVPATGPGIRWPFPPLAPRDAGSLRLRVRLGSTLTPWSDAVPVEFGLGHDGWSALPITPTFRDGSAPLLRRSFELDALPRRARLYATALGIYELRLNGMRWSPDVFEPGWTDYRRRLRYRGYDVTALLTEGRNEVTATLGRGWYSGQLVWPGNRDVYGSELALLAQLEIETAGGERIVIPTDEHWMASADDIRDDDFYDGEAHRPHRSAGEWSGVRTLPFPTAELDVPSSPPVQVTQVVPASSIAPRSPDRVVVDFGQNLVGWVAIDVPPLERPASVRVRHAEVLERGELCTRPLRSAKATVDYETGGAQRLIPSFTFSGFRFAEVTGLGDARGCEISAHVVGTALERTGWLTTSDASLNRLHENVVWSMRGNFLSVPTDCPQRDERLGWTGDLQVFAATACYLYDVTGFLGDWMAELRSAQLDDGGIPLVVPDVMPDAPTAIAGWGDAVVVVPWRAYQATGEARILGENLDAMRRWLDRVRRECGADLIFDTPDQLGDWLDPQTVDTDPRTAATPPALVATAYFARSCELVAESARVLELEDDAARYRALAADVRANFRRAFWSSDGRLAGHSQAGYALALAWGLLPEADGALAGAHLVDLVEAAGRRVRTGFLGTPVLLDALTMIGRRDLALAVLGGHNGPSWLHMVDLGATSIWERWDSLLDDGTVNPSEMTSFNHYALGAVADWMHRNIGGIAPLRPGYRTIEVAPEMTGGLTSASARLESVHGTIACAWQRIGDRYELELTVPFGCDAVVSLPDRPGTTLVEAGTHAFTGPVQRRIPPAAGSINRMRSREGVARGLPHDS